MSIGVGRDAAPPRTARESLDSHLLGRGGADLDLDFDVMSNKSRAASEHPFGADMDLDFGPDAGGGLDFDLNLDFGDKPLSEHAPTPRLTPSRACEYLDLRLRTYLFIEFVQPHLLQNPHRHHLPTSS